MPDRPRTSDVSVRDSRLLLRLTLRTPQLVAIPYVPRRFCAALLNALMGSSHFPSVFNQHIECGSYRSPAQRQQYKDWSRYKFKHDCFPNMRCTAVYAHEMPGWPVTDRRRRSTICLTPAAYVEFMLWRSALQVLQRARSAMTVHHTSTKNARTAS
jgi:hypothetical protein